MRQLWIILFLLILAVPSKAFAADDTAAGLHVLSFTSSTSFMLNTDIKLGLSNSENRIPFYNDPQSPTPEQKRRTVATSLIVAGVIFAGLGVGMMIAGEGQRKAGQGQLINLDGLGNRVGGLVCTIGGGAMIVTGTSLSIRLSKSRHKVHR